MGRLEDALRHLEGGDLESAGETLGITRAKVADGHAFDEDDDSYGRRLRAEVHGAEKADAVRPREAQAPAPSDDTVAIVEDGDGSNGNEQLPPQEPPPTQPATDPDAGTENGDGDSESGDAKQGDGAGEDAGSESPLP